MESIRVQRLRCLSDTGDIQIKPITVLLGENSSGKSTFLRIFPLLKQSVETRTTGPILWNGRLVDFGNYENAHQNSAEEGINFSFKFQITNDNFYYRDLNNTNVFITLELIEDHNTKTTLMRSLILSLFDSKIKMDFGVNGDLTKFDINSLNILQFGTNYLSIKSDSKNLLPVILEEEIKKDRNSDMSLELYYRAKGYHQYYFDSMNQILLDKINTIAKQKSSSKRKLSPDRIESIAYVGIGDSESILANFKSNPYNYKTFSKAISSWTIETPEFQEIKNLLIGTSLPYILIKSDEILGKTFRRISYMGPARATAERYYRTQDLAVDEVDYQGRNLAMFIRNLNDQDLQSFQDWTRQYFGFEVIVVPSSDLVSLKINLISPYEHESKKEEAINIADTGFGFSQILPVITQLWLLSTDRRLDIRLLTNQPNPNTPVIFAIEQPELHLHPRLQGMLTKAFVASIQTAKEHEIDLRLVIETHSETLINKLGDLVAKEQIEADDINIVLFETEHQSGTVTVKTSHFDQDGYLIDWPLGFFEMDMDS